MSHSLPLHLSIRLAKSGDLLVMQDIERAAGQAFADIGMKEVATDDPLTLDALDDYRRAGLAWVAVDANDVAVGYLVAHPLDDNLHVEQVSVHPAHARRGVGRALLEHAALHAKAVGLPALTLTTFATVPWNAPYYGGCGFEVLDEADWPKGLRRIRDREADKGLDRWPRVSMRRVVPG